MRRFHLLLLITVLSINAYAMPFQWSKIDAFPEKISFVYSDHISGTVFLAVSSNGHLYRSLDSGDNWNVLLMPGNPSVRFLRNDFSSKQSWYAVVQTGSFHELWFTPDNGDSWENRYSSESPIKYLSPAILASDTILGAFESLEDNQLQLRKSENGGLDWHDVFTAIDPGVFPVWHTASVWQVHWGKFVSYDYGNSWRELTPKIVFNCNKDTPPSLLSASPEGLFRSQDNLLTWWPVLVQPVDFVTLNPRNSNHLFTGQTTVEERPVLYFTSNSGASFQEWTHGLSGGITDVSIAADWLFLAVSDGSVYKYDERPSDLDDNKRVDGADLIILATAFGSKSGESSYNERADLNGDGIVDGEDLVILSAVFGHRFYYDESREPGDFPGLTD